MLCEPNEKYGAKILGDSVAGGNFGKHKKKFVGNFVQHWIRKKKRIQFRWNREYHVKILNIQQIETLVFNPAFFQQCLAFGAVTVPTGII